MSADIEKHLQSLIFSSFRSQDLAGPEFRQRSAASFREMEGLPTEDAQINEMNLEHRSSVSASQMRTDRRLSNERAPSSEKSSTRTPSLEWKGKQGSFEMDTIYSLAKHLVSGNRSRYVDDEYDLDLSYVTERVIAMAFPGEDLVGPFSTVIRNSLRHARRRHVYVNEWIFSLKNRASLLVQYAPKHFASHQQQSSFSILLEVIGIRAGP